MKVAIQYAQEPINSTSIEPTVWKLELVAKGNQAEIEAYAGMLAVLSNQVVRGE